MAGSGCDLHTSNTAIVGSKMSDKSRLDAVLEGWEYDDGRTEPLKDLCRQLKRECKRLQEQFTAMTAAKNKAVEMLRCTDDGPRTRECYNAVTGRDFDKDIAELEEVK